MSYCLNPACSQPKNPNKSLTCQACDSQLVLQGRYLAIRTLGKGGFGATFLARDLSLPGYPPCVIKQLRPSVDDPSIFEMAKQLFEREAQTLGKVGDHPQVPRLLDYFEYDRQFYLIQEYIKGPNLQKEVRKNGTYSEAAIKQFLSEILPIIKYIHSSEVIHRDIKPANIIRRQQDKQLVLIDFGAVKNQVNTTTLSPGGQTALTAFAVGTAGFAPPEQMAMRPVYASDIYAVGATCIYLLTGKPPKDLAIDVSTGEIMLQKYAYISKNLARVLTKMIDASVFHRYKSADEVLRSLDIESYFDTLSQGLISQPNSTSNINSDSVPTKICRSPEVMSSYRSTTTQLATAIRNRRNRRASLRSTHHASAGHVSNYSRNYQYATAIDSQSINEPTKVAKKVPTKKLDADTVITQYSGGRRDFAQQNLNLLNLAKANLSDSNFHESKLMKVNLRGANLSAADFGGANLKKAHLCNANLSRTYLNRTNLTDADLRGADLSCAHLTNANLTGANLCGANLTDAKVSDEQLARAKTNWRTILPSGKRVFW